MIVASEAEEAWWPPTFRPSPLARRWFALWMVQVESHSTLRSSSARKGRRGSCVMRPGSRGRGTATLGQGPTPPQSRCAKLVRQACAVDPPPPSPYLPSTSERVAQPVEHLTFNQEVLGSSPSALTNVFNSLASASSLLGRRQLPFSNLHLRPRCSVRSSASSVVWAEAAPAATP